MVFTIPSKDVKDLPSNFFITCCLADREVALHDEMASGEEEAKCDHCAGKENLAMVLCQDCVTLLCECCHGYH